MPRWYARAGICITGGSLTDRGGHTPGEPAAYGCAILHGPHVSNFADGYAALAAAHAALPITETTLAATLIRLTDDPASARDMGQAARDLLLQRAGDPSALTERLCELAQAPASHDIEATGNRVPR